MLFRIVKFLVIILPVFLFANSVSASSGVKAVQQKLSSLGYKPGAVDGIWGVNTENALKRFLNSKGLEFDGRLDSNEFELLELKEPRCVVKSHRHIGDILAASWSKHIICPAEVFVSDDLKYETKAQIETTLDAAAVEWGNYGPVEYWVLGADKDAAVSLATKYCQRRADRKNLTFKGCMARETIFGTHNFMSYYEIGAAALKTGRPSGSAGHNGGFEWGIHQFTSSLPLGFEDQLGIPGAEEQKTVLHEYFHAVQHAHVRTLNHEERDNLLGPVWFMEGAAEYMASATHYKLTRYNRLQTLRNGEWEFKFTQQMKRKFERSKELNRKLDCISQMPKATYENPCREFFYDGGAWAIAYLLHKTHQNVLLDGFYPNLDKLGWEGAFKSSFGLSSADFYQEFQAFLKINPDKALKLLPKY